MKETYLSADIFGTIPIAEALLGKGAQLGTVLAFMMGVTTLSLPRPMNGTVKTIWTATIRCGLF